MLKKIFRNRLEFYPYFVILFFWFVSAFLPSFAVKNRPGIVMLGVVTVPSIVLILIASVRTYKTLPETGTLPGPQERERLSDI